MIGELPSIPVGHSVYDFAVLTVVAVLATLKGMELARKFGLLPETESKSNGAFKTVGRLSEESLQTMIRHQTRNELTPLMVKMSEYNDKHLDRLDQINLGIQKVATILEERK